MMMKGQFCKTYGNISPNMSFYTKQINAFHYNLSDFQIEPQTPQINDYVLLYIWMKCEQSESFLVVGRVVTSCTTLGFVHEQDNTYQKFG